MEGEGGVVVVFEVGGLFLFRGEGGGGLLGAGGRGVVGAGRWGWGSGGVCWVRVGGEERGEAVGRGGEGRGLGGRKGGKGNGKNEGVTL